MSEVEENLKSESKPESNNKPEANLTLESNIPPESNLNAKSNLRPKSNLKRVGMPEIIVPPWFKVVAIIAVVWNLLGVLAFAGQMMMSADALAQLPQAEQNLYANTPMWATVAFAVAVIAGTLGSLLLLLKKSLATQVLMLSLVAIITQMFHAFFISNSFAVFGPGGLIMPIMVIVIALILVFLANIAKGNDWLS